MAMYQDRIFAFTPKGELIQLPKGATPVDFAYAIHTTLGDTAVGAKINGRVVPLRTPIDNGDQVQILKSKAQEPQPGWLNFAATGKARAAIRRFVRNKEEDELIALGRKIYDEIVKRLPAPLGKDAQAQALKRLKLKDEDALMTAVARQMITDAQVMNALMPGSGDAVAGKAPAQREAISVRGLTPGVAYDLALCCHPVPGDRIVGLRRPEEAIVVHAIECPQLADGVDADWLDLAWGDGSEGGTARLNVIIRNEPGALGVMAGIFGSHAANILNLRMENRDSSFHTFVVDLEVNDLQHLMRIVAALRAADAVTQAERV
jgi:(p)ppGpp synthase/HD superfamily hydrolase